jgi:hypothetical protein
MLDVTLLALPYFRPIFSGFASGRLNVSVSAQQYATQVEQVPGAVSVGTLISVLTLTSVMWLVNTHNLPALLFR